jgi:hypothetical protein
VKHKNRNGIKVVCYWCKNDKHQFCNNDNEDFNEYLYCHCECQPSCGEPNCDKAVRLTRRAPGTVTRWKHNDPRWDR